MEFLFELLLDLILDTCIEVSQNKKIPKIIRYILIFIICLFFIAIILLITFVGIISLKENIILGIILLLLALFFLIASILKFKKTYLTKINSSLK